MSSPAEKMLTISCPGCAGRFRLPVSLAGRRGRCARCGTIVIVAPPAAAAKQVGWAPPTTSDQPGNVVGSAHPTAAVEPQYIGFECRVCQTRMYGTPDQVGKKFKCPDCGALTVVPPPPKPRAKRAPAALEGEQYEVWEADEQPLPSELVAAQPVYIAVVCRKCETLMYATVDQVGKKVKCPDCSTLHVVPPPPAPAHSKPIVLDGAYAIDPAADPGERPPVLIPPTGRMEFEEREEAKYARALARARRTGKPMTIDARGRPILPRWPLVTGVIPFLFSRGVPARWMFLSAMLWLIGGSLAIALPGIDVSSGGGRFGGGIGAIAGVCLLAIATIIGSLWACALASVLVTIVVESSEGNDGVEYWLSSPTDWFSSLLYLLVAVPVSAFPGWGIAQFVVVDRSQHALWTMGSVWFCLPLVLLSQLALNSPWAVVSGKVLRSYARRPISWAMLYIESGALMVGCAYAAVAAVNNGVGTLLLSAPVYVAAGLVYARLVGRLAWCISETGEPSARG